MKRIVILAVLVCPILAGSVQAVPSHKLRSFEARSAAENAAYEFERRRKLDSNTIGRCKRQARRRMLCLATVTGETTRTGTTCRLQIKVRAVYPGYWTERASVVWRRCQSETKPYLTYPDALAAVQAEADRFAEMPTLITYMSRRDDLTFAATARWERPRVPPSEVFPTDDCSLDLVATLSSGSVSVANDGFLCF